MVQMTNLVRRLASHQPSSCPSTSQLSRQGSRHALSLLPEAAGVDVARFVDVVFDTDAQSSEITAPSEMSDKDLAHATRAEIEKRIRMAGADIVVPKGVYRWMVASDFAKRWPSKVRHVRQNPWPGLEHVWGLPSGLGGGEGPDPNQCAGKADQEAAFSDATKRMVPDLQLWNPHRASRQIRLPKSAVEASIRLSSNLILVVSTLQDASMAVSRICMPFALLRPTSSRSCLALLM